MHFSCDTCGKVVDLLPEIQSEANAARADTKPSKYAAQIAQLHMHNLEPAAATSPTPSEPSGGSVDPTPLEPSSPTGPESGSTENAAATEGGESAVDGAVTDAQAALAEMDAGAGVAQAVETGAVAAAAAVNVVTPVVTREPSSVDTFLHYLTVAVLVALFALVYRKLLKMQGVLQ